jgi:hypothetical protein
MKYTKVLLVVVLVLSMVLAWSVLGKDKGDEGVTKLTWDRFDCHREVACFRGSIPTGWLVVTPSSSIAFVSDPNHEWK